jgi:hypothetical protein
MDPSTQSREAEHLLANQPTTTTEPTQDQLEPTHHRPLEPNEPENLSSPGDSDIRYTIIAGNEPSEVPSTLASPTSTVTTEKDRSPNLPDERTIRAPWSLRRLSLLGFIAFLISLVVVLEILYFVSNKHQGLTTSGKKTYYLWKYCPTASKFEPRNTRQTI